MCAYFLHQMKRNVELDEDLFPFSQNCIPCGDHGRHHIIAILVGDADAL